MYIPLCEGAVIMIEDLQVSKPDLVIKVGWGKNQLEQKFHDLGQSFNECLIGKGAWPLVMHLCAADSELLSLLCRVSSWVQLRQQISKRQSRQH